MKTAVITSENHGSENLSRRMIRVESSGWVFASSDGSRKILGFQTSELLMQNHMAAWIYSIGMHGGLSVWVHDLPQHFFEHGIFHGIFDLQENKQLKIKDKKGLLIIEWE